MLNKPPSKDDIRRALERQIKEFTERGESIQSIPKGVSGRDSVNGPLKPETWQLEKSKGDRTYLNEVVEKLDNRRGAPTTKQIRSKDGKTRQRKRLIYDDFGEPLRWVWVDE